MPRIPGLLERIQQPLYDTQIIRPKETHWNFFQEPLSSSKRVSVFEVPIDAFSPELVCSLCKENVFGSDKPTPGLLNSLHNCTGCSTIYHKSCMREMSGCATLGCTQEGLTLKDLQDTRIKTLVDTNMDQGGSLPYPKNFEIHSISLHFDKTVDKYELDTFKEYSFFKLFIGTKDYLNIPVAVLDELQTTGMHYGYSLAEPIDIIPQMNFRTEITYRGPKKRDTTFRLRNVLQGFFKREVH